MPPSSLLYFALALAAVLPMGGPTHAAVVVLCHLGLALTYLDPPLH